MGSGGQAVRDRPPPMFRPPACFRPARQPVTVPAAALRRTIQTVASQAGNRATQHAVLAVQRETAQDVIIRYSDWGGLSVREGALGQYLGQRARAGDYTIVTQVVHANELHSYEKDDVAVATMKQFCVPDVIMMARNQDCAATHSAMTGSGSRPGCVPISGEPAAEIRLTGPRELVHLSGSRLSVDAGSSVARGSSIAQGGVYVACQSRGTAGLP